ncbi:T9SS type A sorting domain-containing protein [Aestuariibaculum suncheonense]|uniref:T9SS type A sorting domain-containing protein n=1 Tax=Aestuariibaculum suncheonense TaxID=1028745 RepID=A0A8J6QBA6_9FLAO|nr:T9SS type A sorting domain-containing protein [Aestuariibaculum suncheonense]MBD0836989.1 T9SS type A sorting domain-containing protein [Aestuariibaculum suncheonense]
MKNIFFLFYLVVYTVSAQDYILPNLKESFALKKHTNRDVSYFLHSNSQGEIFSIGTTERDSSFTDIITSKLDINQNLIWQKKFSLATNLSYDLPLKSYLDSSGSLIIIGRSSYNQSNSNGKLFVVKYDSDGNEIWSKTIGNIDGSDYYDYAYFNSFFENENLKIVYIPVVRVDESTNSSTNVIFINVNSDGLITEEHNINRLNNGIHCQFNNGVYYLLIREDQGSGYPNYYLRKIGVGYDEEYLLNSQLNFIPENFTEVVGFLELDVDAEENLYVTKPKLQGDTNEFSYTKVNKLGQVEYSKNVLGNIAYIGSYINQDNKFCFVYEDTDVNKIVLRKIDDLGSYFETKTIDSNGIQGSLLNSDNSIFITDENNNISLLSDQLVHISDFTPTLFYQITDLNKISDDEIVIAGTTYDKMYSNSDFYAQRNIVVEKLSQTQTYNAFMYSGEGTSKAFGQKLLIDNNDNYIVLSEEKLGPDNWQIGGSRAPLKKLVYKYDKNLNLIWKIELPNFLIEEKSSVIDSENNLYINSSVKNLNNSPNQFELIKISPEGNVLFKVPSFRGREVLLDENNNVQIASLPLRNDATYDDDTEIYTFDSSTGELLKTSVLEGLELLNSFKSSEGYSYLYMYTGSNTYGDTSPRIDIYKNSELYYSVNLAIYGTYGAIGAYDIGEKGELYFGSSWGQINGKFHKITLDKQYKYINVDDRYNTLKVLNNGKIFAMIDLGSNNEGQPSIFNEDLSLFSRSNEIYYNYSKVVEMSEVILLNSYYDNLVKVINKNCDLVDQFKMESSLGYARLDSENNLILTGQQGNQVYLNHEYSWARGILHKYSYLGPKDDDEDGIANTIDLCENTSIGETVDNFGCSESQKDDDEDGVMNNLDLCPETPFGEVVNSSGCSSSQIDDDNDGVFNDKDKCPNSYYIDMVGNYGCFKLPVDNFKIEGIGETCIGKNNAIVNISANTNIDYVLSFNGKNYPFTSNLTIENIEPGTYDLCISVPMESYEQCYSITLDPGVSISGKTMIDQNGKLSVKVDKGTAPYKVIKNKEAILETFSNSFYVDVLNGDLIEIQTSKICEGELSKIIQLKEGVFVYPNPSDGEFEINLASSKKEVDIELYSVQSQLISRSRYSIENNKVVLDIKDVLDGVYFLKVYLDEPQILKIVKQ